MKGTGSVPEGLRSSDPAKFVRAFYEWYLPNFSLSDEQLKAASQYFASDLLQMWFDSRDWPEFHQDSDPFTGVGDSHPRIGKSFTVGKPSKVGDQIAVRVALSGPEGRPFTVYLSQSQGHFVITDVCEENAVSFRAELEAAKRIALQGEPQSSPSQSKVETLTESDIQAGGIAFDGTIRSAPVAEENASNETLFQEYGAFASSTFKKHPEVVAALRQVNPTFDPDTMATSLPNSVVTLGRRTLLILQGCFPHNCGGTGQIAAYEPATKKAYLLRPTNVGANTEPSGKFHLYGAPDSAIRAAMCKAYSW